MTVIRMVMSSCRCLGVTNENSGSWQPIDRLRHHGNKGDKNRSSWKQQLAKHSDQAFLATNLEWQQITTRALRQRTRVTNRHISGEYKKQIGQQLMSTTNTKFIFLTISIIWLGFLMIQGVAQENPHVVMDLECNTCHVTSTWHEVEFDHSKTAFPLTDRHDFLECKTCHTSVADFQALSAECSSCHEDVHQAKFGYDCASCHNTRGWRVLDVLSAHQNTTFPFVGAHANLDCQACHHTEITGDFVPIFSQCISCHQSDYENTTNPNHITEGFQLTCESCHSPLAWEPARLADHDSFFPIYTGNHAGEWSNCSDCHTQSGTFQLFSCIDCHEHNRPDMDDEHDDVSGYIYESNACYSCHPRGD